MIRYIVLFVLIFCIVDVRAQNSSNTELKIYDRGYAGLAYLSKGEKPYWGFMGGWLRYYQKYNISLILDGSIDLNFEENYQPSSSRYYWDTFSNGQTRCRDRQTGRFASSSLCESSTTYDTNTTFRITGSLNYHFEIEDNVDFIAGVGYAISNHSTPILSIGVTQKPYQPGFSGLIGFGKKYAFVGVTYLF